MSGDRKSTVLGDFLLKRKLGKGGMGTVYLGHQISLDRDCAVKVLSKEFAQKPGFVERFIREARAMARIDHPNVVTCYAVGEEKGYNYVAMELMDGQSMQDWVDQLGRLSVPDAILTALICADALEHAHEMGMIHRDVKPDNILVTKKGVIKVSDLGLAKAVDDDEELGLTQSGTGLGTPHYMAPEQARNAKYVDRRVDVYALGGTLYFLLTGENPFTGESVLELIMNKEKGQFISARRHNPEIPERLDLIIDKALAAKREHRYQTCAHMISDLESLGLAGESLSFIEDAQRIVPQRAGGAVSTSKASSAKIPQTKPKKKTARASNTSEFAKSQTMVNSSGQWYVKRIGSDGRVKVGKMTAPQIVTAMKTDKLNGKTTAATSSKGPFLPLAQFREFEEEAKRMLTRQVSKERDNNLAAEYQKLAKQYERRKLWRSLWKLTNSAVGFVGLLVWIALIAGVIIGLYYIIPWAFDQVASQVGVQES
ncbi:Serine/threonine-protein kinase PrkC [Thalassoglobus neptunius]|uniref:non-specific serine/threonine protein kinase n=1 Tax=Thalassoglobus neptunius TaxID=1938619 RepID=A0A5C5WLQ4_9PLAN|nr:serine/threonine-protein kinase [Thalassoglobus neptunius]TWT51600.1 Serine/threonine-protein kinase PrkC [Thalassoglobus neptunius]